jgi:DEAD/DEAH box helicase domain-containing protein
VEKLDYENKKAFVRSVEVDYYTDAEMSVNIKVLSDDRQKTIKPGIDKYMGEVQVSALVAMFKKIKFHTHENIGSGPITLPEQELHTTSYWISFGSEITAGLSPNDISSGISGIASLLYSIAPLYLMCDPRDIHRTVQVKAPFTEKPTIFLYDSYPGGIGLSERIFDLSDELFLAARVQLESCSCSMGCPSCVGPNPDIGTRGKEIALHMLRMITGSELDK